jgi:glucan phosphorylase
MENVFASMKNRTISQGILNMDEEESFLIDEENFWIDNQLDKIISSITHTLMNVAHTKYQDELLNETITKLMEAQISFNKYVIDTK